MVTWISGDSYSQTGFNIASTKPSSLNPLGNPAYPGYTTSGGPNWIGYLVKNHNTSLLLSYNFADGGATVNASLVKPFRPTVKSLIDQVKIFSDSIANKPSYASWTAETGLFAVWLGVNDVGNSYSRTNETGLYLQIMDSYFSQLDILYRAGARSFALLSVPRRFSVLTILATKLTLLLAIDKSPLMLGQSKEAQSTEAGVIKRFNALLADRLEAFVEGHEGSKGWIVDTQGPFNKAIDNPGKYGSKDATCYNSDGKTCLWYNDYHPATVSVFSLEWSVRSR